MTISNLSKGTNDHSKLVSIVCLFKDAFKLSSHLLQSLHGGQLTSMLIRLDHLFAMFMVAMTILLNFQLHSLSIYLWFLLHIFTRLFPLMGNSRRICTRVTGSPVVSIIFKLVSHIAVVFRGSIDGLCRRRSLDLRLVGLRLVHLNAT